MEPLKIGILGASRISEAAIIKACDASGHRKYAVAARNPSRAEEFAAQHGFEKVHDSYEALLADPEVDLVYIGLPNGLHAPWTIKAVQAGKKVLTEKPFASNLAEYDSVMEVVEQENGTVWEAFHHGYHPLVKEALRVISSGELGKLQHIELHMDMHAPASTDPRWNFDLAGGALMDTGCYAVNTALLIAEALGEKVEITSASAVGHPADPRVDARIAASGSIGDIPLWLQASMASHDWDFSITARGEKGVMFVPSFPLPTDDDRLLLYPVQDGAVAAGAEAAVSHWAGETATYQLQLEAIADQIARGASDPALNARSRETAELIDRIYSLAGLPLR